MSITRDEIRALCTEARREAATSPVRKSNGNGLVYRTNANGAQASAPAQDGAASESEAYPAFSDLRAGICQFVVEFVRQKLSERDRKIERLEAKLDAVLAIIGSDKAKSVSHVPHDDSVVDLPDWRKRHA